MKVSVLASCATILGYASAAGKCNRDDCARAVTGANNRLQPSRMSDCSSYQSCTVTPPVSVVTVTSTVTPTASTTITPITTLTQTTTIATVTVTPGVLPKRQALVTTAVTNCGTSVPTYASACSGAVRFASACSCGGVTRSLTTISASTSTTTVITTAPTPVTTVSSTVTEISSVTATQTASPAVVVPPSFVPYVPTDFFFLTVNAPGSQYDRLSIYIDIAYTGPSSPAANGLPFTMIIRGQGYASRFVLSDVDASRYGALSTQQPNGRVVRDPVASDPYSLLVEGDGRTSCALGQPDAVTGVSSFQCLGNGGVVGVFQICPAFYNPRYSAPYLLLIEPDSTREGCEVVTLTAVGPTA